jgi:osomolarity two-component system, sensor histidine kinase SLN1
MPVRRPLTPTAVDMADPDHLPMPVSSGSARSSRGRRRDSTKKSARIDDGPSGRTGKGLKVHWAKFKRHLGTGTAPSSSSQIGDGSTVGSSFYMPRAGAANAEREVDEKEDLDEVVVDRDWMHEIKSSVVSPSERGGIDAPVPTGGTQTDHDSTAFTSSWSFATPFLIIRYRLWPSILEFFSPKFYDEKNENHYRKENWFMGKVCV